MSFMKTVAKALVIDKQGSILVLRRSGTHPHFPYHLDFPGGEVEEGEDPKSAVAREIKEETSLTVEPSELALCFQKVLPDALTHILLTTSVNDIQPKIVVSWEHDKHSWLALGALLREPLPPNADSYYVDVIKWLSSRPAS